MRDDRVDASGGDRGFHDRCRRQKGGGDRGHPGLAVDSGGSNLNRASAVRDDSRKPHNTAVREGRRGGDLRGGVSGVDRDLHERRHTQSGSGDGRHRESAIDSGGSHRDRNIAGKDGSRDRSSTALK